MLGARGRNGDPGLEQLGVVYLTGGIFQVVDHVINGRTLPITKLTSCGMS